MPRKSGEPEDIGLVIAVLRLLRRWSQSELARRSGVDQSAISDYELGKKTPTRGTVERLAAAVGVRYALIEELLPRCREIRLAFEAATGQTETPEETGLDPGLAGRVTTSVTAALAPFLQQLSDLEESSPRPEDRAWAEELWARMEPLAEKDQEIVVGVLLGDERSWALAERFCAASEAAAAHRADDALRLARLAVRIAERVPGPLWSLRLRGWCEPFLANALRVGGDLNAAAKAFDRADELWEQGAGGDPAGLLAGTRRLDLKASLLLYGERFEEALSLLAQALRNASTDQARARLLLKKARALEFTGQYHAALEALQQAEPGLDGRPEPRLLNVLQFNRTVNLLHLDRYTEAERLLPQVEALTELRNELDRVRLRWLQGRTWAGLGRRPEAVAALSEVRRYFHAEKIAYDFALVSLELAVLHLEEGRARLVQELAEEMLWIFESQKVHEQALAALGLFCHATRSGEVQVEWAQRLVKYLYRAEHNPGLRFEP